VRPQMSRARWQMALLAAAVTAVAACGSSSSSSGGASGGGIQTGPGIDAASKTINLGVLTPLSGPVAAPIGVPLTKGQETYFKAAADRGLLEGWKVNLIEKDTAYTPQQEVQQYNATVNQVAFYAQSLGSPTTLAIQQLADSAGILIGAATQSGSWVTDKVMITIGDPYSIDMANGIDWIVNKLGKKTAKIGIIYQNDEYGQDGLRGYKAALAAYQFNDVGELPFAATDTDFSSQIAAMKGAGAEYVALVATPSSAGKIVGTGAAGGYVPNWLFQGPAWSSLLMATPLKAVLPGHVYVLGYQPQWGDTSVPGMQQFLADHAKYAADQAPDYYYMYGYTEAEIEVAIIKKAIDSGDLTRQGLLNAKLNLGSFSFGGLLPDLTYTPQLGPASTQTGVTVVDASVPAFLKQVQPFFEGDAAKSIKFPYS